VIDSNHGVKRARSLTILATPLLHDETKLESVHVPPGGFQTFFRGRFDSAHIAALQGQARAIPLQAARACDGPCPMAPAASNVADHGGTADDGIAQDIAARNAAASVIVTSDLRSRIEALPATTSKLDN